VKMKRNAKGRFVKRASNPKRRRRKHNPTRHHVRRSRARSRKSNPQRKYRRRAHNPIRRHRAKRRHRNPFSLPSASGILGKLKPAAIGGGGAILNSVALGYLTPMIGGFAPFLTSGYGLHALRIGTSLGLGIVGKKFGGRMGEIAGEGALTVAMYLLLRDVVVAFAPSLPLGDYEEISIDSTSDQIGAYMNGRLPDGSAGPMGRIGAYMDPAARLSGMGAYMSGAFRADENYAESSDGFTLNGLDY
jgi:hypothetical protein